MRSPVDKYMNTHVLFPFSDPVHAGHAGKFPAGITFYGVHGIGEIDISVGFYGTETETNGKQTVPRESLGWERENKYFHGNRSDGNRRSILRSNYLGIVWVG